MGDEIKNNSEILFIYEAKMCNPNGDPDDENKPRMDYNRNINLVSDVRLKRYIRDYLMDYKGETIFVSKSEGSLVNAKTSLATILDIENKAKISINSEEVKTFLNKAIDVRMFGAIVPDVTFKDGKGNVTFTGPIQFNWGYSLNKVTGPMESSGITSHFQTGKITEEEESTKGSGAMGKDYRVDYSIIAFHGIISAKRAEHTGLKTTDIDLFDEAMIKSIPLEATTRSKIGQNPLLYIRVEYNNPEFFLCDFRKYVEIKPINEDCKSDTSKLRSTKDYKLDLSKLKEKLNEQKDKLKEIRFWKDEDLQITGFDELTEGGTWEYKEDGKEEKTREIKFISLPSPSKTG
ncbi:MAG: type I-B CRISPR-associated protein Cas7/Csh2 [Spirochaetes bacterium]|nr:MAG: type I-B CRISPR-associated protein Cas7/Csh2 [Spirochaetota bacterium]